MALLASPPPTLQPPARRRARPFFILALILLLSSASAAPLLGGRLEGQVRTLDGEQLYLESIRFRTPRDFNRLAPGEPPFTLDASPAPPPFSSIQRITFDPLSAARAASRPESMEVYRLGDVRMAVPPPPDWQREHDQIPPWTRAVATANTDHLPYVDGAVFCWAPADAAPVRGPVVYLFRQAFTVDSAHRVARATLRLAANAEIIEAALNERPLHLATPPQHGLVELEVTPLLRPGVNVLALRVRERTGRPDQGYGLAFHVDILRRNHDAAVAPLPAHPTLLLAGEGERLWGALGELGSDRISLQTEWGDYIRPLADATGLLFPSGWPATPERRAGLLGRVFGPGRDPADLPSRHGLPTATAPDPLQDRLLLTEGRAATARLGYERDGQIHFESDDGKPFAVPVGDILAIYPPRPLDWAARRPGPTDALLYCRLTTNRGDCIAGQLRQLDSSGALLETESGAFLTIPRAALSEILFPYHAVAGPGSAAAARRPVAIIPLAAGNEAYKATYDADVRLVQGATFGLGAESVSLAVDDLLDPARLDPLRYPVTVYLDPVGEYLHTYAAPADAREALASYVDRGGTLVTLSRGGAFRTAVRAERGAFRRSPAELVPPILTDAFSLRTLHPSDAGAAAVIPFNHPPNTGRPLAFQRASQVPDGLMGMTRRIPLRSMISAPFYPMVAADNAATALYELRDADGTPYGPALQIIPRGRGMLVIIDHLLWESEIDGLPFTTLELPTLLSWSLRPPPQ